MQEPLEGPREELQVDHALGDAEMFITSFCYDGMASWGDMWLDAACQTRKKLQVGSKQ